MSDTAAKREWVKNTFDIDIPESGGDGEVLAKGGDEHAKGFFDSIAEAVGGVVDDVVSAVFGDHPADKDLEAALKELSDEAATLKGLGFETKQIMADHATQAKRGVTAEKLTDPAERTKALDDVKATVAEQIEHAKALGKSIKNIMGASKSAPTADQKAAIYKDAIEKLYDVSITIPSGMKNTHLDKVFDMLGTLPKKDVKQEKFKTLQYNDAANYKGSGAYSLVSPKIIMGDFGDATGKEDYQIDGKTIPANSFNVTTLHEVGHAVDDKHKIMDANGSKAGCGGWNKESLGSTVAAFLPELKKAVTVAPGISDQVLSDAIETALKAGTTAQPTGVGLDDWKPILKYLVDNCLKIRSAAKPWFASSQIALGDRVYQEAYSNNWWSYSNAARSTTKVNNYQWRSPAEWFAEVYAISWLAKKKAPAGVDASIAEYMFKP